LKFILFLTAILFLNSCNQNSGKIYDANKPNDSLKNDIQEKLDLIITQPKSENRQIPKTWKSLATIQQNWIEVKKDKMDI